MKLTDKDKKRLAAKHGTGRVYTVDQVADVLSRPFFCTNTWDYKTADYWLTCTVGGCYLFEAVESLSIDPKQARMK